MISIKGAKEQKTLDDLIHSIGELLTKGDFEDDKEKKEVYYKEAYNLKAKLLNDYGIEYDKMWD